MSTTNLNNICDTLSSLTILEVSELSKMLEEKWNVSAAISVTAAPAVTTASGDASANIEKDSFNIILKDFGSSKINVIKEVRTITGLGLKEAKELVESAPKAVKEGANKKEADEIKSKLEEAGAVVELT